MSDMSVQDSIGLISKLINEEKDKAKIICDTYWALFQIKNREFFSTGEIGKIGTIAPRIREYKDPPRYRIVWSVFKKTKKNSPMKGLAIKDIPFPQRGLTEGSFSKEGALDWEKKLAFEQIGGL
jgi:hypothetical protein